jgi:hypothetical protein
MQWSLHLAHVFVMFDSLVGPWQPHMCLLSQTSRWLHHRVLINGSKMNNQNKNVNSSFWHLQIKTHHTSVKKWRKLCNEFLFVFSINFSKVSYIRVHIDGNLTWVFCFTTNLWKNGNFYKKQRHQLISNK